MQEEFCPLVNLEDDKNNPQKEIEIKQEDDDELIIKKEQDEQQNDLSDEQWYKIEQEMLQSYKEMQLKNIDSLYGGIDLDPVPTKHIFDIIKEENNQLLGGDLQSLSQTTLVKKENLDDFKFKPKTKPIVKAAKKQYLFSQVSLEKEDEEKIILSQSEEQSTQKSDNSDKSVKKQKIEISKITNKLHSKKGIKAKRGKGRPRKNPL
ncbi:UNKNOWN [Stylonychia lemnae]|uniref:Uncharacterized protein n=1 Tax=Stylonychia lemnae TaxID=5949 RepID=A0A078ARE7_STYLE|nr:UNKNOWN [Stylonychia lemnae]|eukprot:CDW83418.1 UNKNOWN [Stylonychia lemnae]